MFPPVVRGIGQGKGRGVLQKVLGLPGSRCAGCPWSLAGRYRWLIFKWGGHMSGQEVSRVLPSTGSIIFIFIFFIFLSETRFLFVSLAVPELTRLA